MLFDTDVPIGFFPAFSNYHCDGLAHVVSRPPINASMPPIKFYYTRKKKRGFQRAGSD